MKTTILEESKTKIKIELEGETPTLCNILRSELWNDSHVKIAGYKIDHPLTSHPVLVIETDGKESPKKALKEAIKRLTKTNQLLQNKIKSLKL